MSDPETETTKEGGVAPETGKDDAPSEQGAEQRAEQPVEQPGESHQGIGTGSGRSDAPHSGIGAQDSAGINANLAGLAAGTVRLVG